MLLQAHGSSMSNYYGNINLDLLSKVPINAKRVLEIGCGSGRLGEAFKARSPSAQYFGIEKFEPAALEARTRLDDVLCIDLEEDLSLTQSLAPRFDALVFGDVLEHLQDPWHVLAELRHYIEPGGVCVACIPNVAHWSVLSGLLQGQWRYADEGLLDRTHLRFFTLDSAIDMFQKAGWTVLDASATKLLPDHSQSAMDAMLPAAMALGATEKKARSDLSTYQWVIRALNGPDAVKTNVAAVGIKKFAGVTEARIDHPMRALESLPEAKALWSEGKVTLPDGVTEGVLVLHRELMTDEKFKAQMEKLIASGWLLVNDIDDDPYYWDGFVDSNFYAFRGVHAVTVSTEHLAGVIRQFNPNVQVFSNAMLSIPHVIEKNENSGPVKIFFGALNREADWQAVISGICQAALELKERIEFVVVHDKGFYDALPDEVPKTFLPTLEIEKYTEVLASCDIALLPLNDTEFNRCKSDLKLIECAATQVAVICSKVVYATNPEHAKFVEFATTPEEWHESLLQLVNKPALRKERTVQGLAYVKAQRMHAQQAPQRLAFYQSMLKNRKELERQRLARIGRA